MILKDFVKKESHAKKEHGGLFQKFIFYFTN